MAGAFRNVYGQEIELTGEQTACLNYKGDRTLMVKGYAGAGKSIVLMAIADRYKKLYKGSDENKVAILTFQNTLVDTIREALVENGDQTITVSTVNGGIKRIYEWMVSMGIAPRRRFPRDDRFAAERRLKNVEAALLDHRSRFGPHRFHSLPASFWLEEFDWMKDMNIWTEDKERYLALPRTGRGGKVRMRALDRVVAYQLFETYCRILDRSGQADWADQTLFVIRHSRSIPMNMRYDHVLVDEAQDLSLAQMTAILGLYKKDMTVALDMNQRIHGKYWTPKLLGIETTTKKLTKSMRTTKQIDNLAESIRCHNDEYLTEDDKSYRAIPEREGPVPKLIHLKDALSEKRYVQELVKAYRKQNKDITIGLVGARNDHLETFSSWMADAHVPHEIIRKDTTFSMKEPGVKIVTAYSAKGLEFHVIIIPLFVQGNFPHVIKTDDQELLTAHMIRMRNLVYVSMTRAKSQLVITYQGKRGSQFIGEMDPRLYVLEGEPLKGCVADPIKVMPPSGGNDDTGEGGSGPDTPPTPPKPPTPRTPPEKGSLLEYLQSVEGLTVSDKRSKGGGLWISGDQQIVSAVRAETRKTYGAMWIYSDKRAAYFTKCTK